MTLPIKNGWFGRKRHIRLYMDLSTTCDIRCVQCFREAIIPPPMKVTRAQLEILEREVFPYIERLSLSCTGEPLYLPIFPEALRAAKRAGVPYVRIQTNATHLDEAMSALLLDEGLSHLGVSLDAATKETFERIRVGADWEMVTGNIRRFVEMRNARRRVEPEVSLNFTLMTDNCHEALPLIDLARDLGVTSISYHHMIVERPEMKSHNLAYDPPRMNALLQSLREQAAARGVHVSVPKDLPDTITPWEGPLLEEPVYNGRCIAAEDSWMFLIPDGHCFPCLNLRDRFTLGNVFTTPFRDIWYGESNQAFRGEALRNQCARGCDHCKAVLTEDTGHELAYLAKRLTTRSATEIDRLKNPTSFPAELSLPTAAVNSL